MRLLIISILGFLVTQFAFCQTISVQQITGQSQIQIGNAPSQPSGTNTLQWGNQNQAYVQAQYLTLAQMGNNQTFQYLEGSIPSQMNIEMIGQNNSLSILGSNSISARMQVLMFGQERQMTIINYR